ncbi:MAG: DUF418 domain-containing protein [Pseudomonadota bacterium]
MQSLANQTGDRIVQLDALRGLAVIGIAWMNVYVFALPLQAYYNPIVLGGDAPADRLVWLVSFVFIEDKFRTLFAMLFGAGCLILLEKSQERAWRAHAARMAVLFSIGLAHSILLASNDVLRAYAIAGLALPFLRGLSAPALYAVATGLLAVHVGGGIVVFGSAVVDFYAGRLSTDAVIFAERNFGALPGAVEYAMGLGREGLLERILRRSASITGQLAALSGSLPINLAAMALGMGLWRDGMLSGKWRTFRMQRLAAACALVAIPPLLAIGWWVADTGFPGALVGSAALILSAPFDTLLGLAYALTVMALLRPEGIVAQRLAAVGRLSLTNYVATSVIFAALFASWGLGWFGEVSRSEALGLSLVPIGAMLLWSPIWLSRFGQGPIERLWRYTARLFS